MTIIEYLETGILPEEEGIARRLVLTKSRYACVPHDMRKRGRFGAMLRYTVHFTSIIGGIVCVLISHGSS